MKEGASIESILFFRYAIAVLLLGAFLLLRKQSFKVSWKQAACCSCWGLLYTTSSLTLFEAYKYIASGLATTIVFLYPVLVAIIMVFLKVVPSWPVWLSIGLTFVGVVIMTQSDSSQTVNPIGLLLSFASALVYALFIVIINRSKVIGNISNSLLTFYALSVGTIVFLGKIALSDTGVTTGLTGHTAWLSLVGLAVLPTIVSTATLAIATPQHRGHQGFRARCLRARHGHSGRNTRLRRSAYDEYCCWHSDFDGGHYVHDCHDQAIGFILTL